MMTLASSISYSIQNTTTQKHIHTLTRTRFHQLRILFACIIRAVCRMHMLQKTCFSVIQSDRTIHRNRIARTRHEFAWVYVNAKHDQTYGNDLCKNDQFFFMLSHCCVQKSIPYDLVSRSNEQEQQWWRQNAYRFDIRLLILWSVFFGVCYEDEIHGVLRLKWVNEYAKQKGFSILCWMFFIAVALNSNECHILKCRMELYIHGMGNL